MQTMKIEQQITDVDTKRRARRPRRQGRNRYTSRSTKI